ncbi:hypothetical protein EHRUM4_00990 [Ehrlichia ruminantium]|uniref:DUF1467 family protein n=2 Tax=Ehrlichia ruminantium TaxID=779 RepID=A0A170TTE5_EHRRU|nr:DUF1467 family protein [Ehrlichia ruminantium]GAT76904.1 hypothetical protein EHRUM2_01020 [Ehrlichia ruminantium]GAT77922.1 hypothetical protein EHRUM3_01240 [Ehrlichia ruminantium]GAT79102.1 hypothetical protein EHRUM4_00990 [Ehrlichia ruminantium]
MGLGIMGIGDVIFFIVSWWIILFLILPIKVEVPDNPEIGIASSAPIKSYLLIKTIITTITSILLTVLYIYLKAKGYIDFERIYDLIDFI